MGISQATRQAMLDGQFPTAGAGDHIAYSTNGTSEAAIIARTAIGATGWAAATAASPSVKSNAIALTTAAASGAGTITHFAVYSAATAGSMKTDWQALGSSRTVASGDVLTWAVGALDIELA
ncbi:MAG: hypothetical protein R2732_05465 [Microbacteriaceae bacterium]|jgi:hypothetical protein